MLTPYYDQDGITIYCGDAMDVLNDAGVCGATICVTDPPYGVSGIQNTRTALRRGSRKNEYVSMIDSPTYVKDIVVPIIERIISKIPAIVTPGNVCFGLYPVAASFGCIIQPASVGLQPWGRADSQPILFYGKSPMGGTKLPSCRCTFTNTDRSPSIDHPCPKPMPLWNDILNTFVPKDAIVLDPFMGSGTTLLCARDQGKRAIGIEREEKYCKVAVDRLAQTNLFTMIAPNPAVRRARSASAEASCWAQPPITKGRQ